MNFASNIGLEIHVALNTKTKLFSPSLINFGAEPNTLVAPFDIAFPGSLPSVNKQAVIKAIRVCGALHMKIDHELCFDRKHYFYSDLPKGYQITQKFRPLGKHGYLDLKQKKIKIESLHLEEDTCKQIHTNNETLLDFNRSGIPLLEIVCSPEIQNAEEAVEFIEKIRSIVTFLDVSDGKMENGSLRCDINISMHPIGQDKFGKKVEIKNLNSLANIQKAIEYEIIRQQSLLLSGQSIDQQTFKFNEKSGKTELLRQKSNDIDYHYLPESNIPPIQLSDEFIDDIIQKSNVLPDVRFNKYLSYGLSEYDAHLLLIDKDTSDYYDEVINLGVRPKLAANWINVDIKGYLNKNNILIKDFKIKPSIIAHIIKQIENGQISHRQARQYFDQILDGDKIETATDKFKEELIKDEKQLKSIINDIIVMNPQCIIDYNNGKNKVVAFLVGEVMKKTKGKAEPIITNKLIIESLKGD